MEDVIDLEAQLLVASPRVENHACGGLSARKRLQKAILGVQCLKMFTAGASHGSSPEQDQNAINEDIEEVDQTVPLLGTVDDTLHSRKHRVGEQEQRRVAGREGLRARAEGPIGAAEQEQRRRLAEPEARKAGERSREPEGRSMVASRP
ncbi:hypothetical protein E3N88_33505 [Mikania micrantha]|uniref:Uncharacterized protein n=1 Tax=Mikania micrantha TaxID=192012 RepID=A0A5N6MBM8_9ASTR|nr:hypothetical protein E3N88_33505 [Mikania micrantha]